MNNQSQIGEKSEVDSPAPGVEEQTGETTQLPDQQEDTLSEGDKMLLDYAYLTFLY